jgi:hypothetical protein
MTVELVARWPFVRMKPSKLELDAKEALERFEKAERRALGANEERIEELKDEIGGLTRDVRNLTES